MSASTAASAADTGNGYRAPLSEEDRALLAGLRNGEWLDKQEFPPVSWTVPGIVPEGMSLLIGGPKVGKSWMSLDLALAVASGGVAFGCIEVGPPRSVLLLALEDSDRRIKERTRTLEPWARIPKLFTYLTRVKPGYAKATIQAWLRTLDPFGLPPLVILDTYGKAMPAQDRVASQYAHDYAVAGGLKEACDEHPGMSLVVLHHDRKASADDFVDAVSGTNGIAGAADTILVIARPRNEPDGLLKVTGRDVTEAEYAVSFKDCQWRLVGDSLVEAVAAAEAIHMTQNLGDQSAQIVRHVNAHPEGVRAADVAAALNIEDAKKVGTYLARLAESGRIRKADRGLYTPVESVESVESDPGETFDSTLSTHSTHPHERWAS
jgi:hypothetical protein